MRLFRDLPLISTAIVLCAVGVTSAAAQTGPVARVSTDLRDPIDPVVLRMPASPSDAAAKDRSFVSLDRAGVQTANTLALSLDDAIRRALQNNNDIEVVRDDVRIQEQQVRSLLGVYDPVLSITPTFTRNSTTGSSATNDISINSSLGQQLRTGGSYSAFFNNNRTENAFAQAQVSSGQLGSSGTSAIYFSSFGVRFTQPLFRNRGIDNTRRNLTIARKRLQQSDADFRQRTMDIIRQVQRSYWDLVFALRDQQNRQANLDLSRENLRLVEARIAAGASAPLARAEVETELANREADLLIATQQVSIVENILKQLLLRDPLAPEWSQGIVPTDRPAFSLEPVSLDDAVKDAVASRHELQRLRLEAEVNRIDLDFFRNQTKPQIDFNTTFSMDGLSRSTGNTESFTVPLIATDAASIQTNASAFLLSQIRRFHGGLPTDSEIPTVTIPATPSFLVGGFGRSLANTFRSDSPNFSIGVTFSFPIGNRAARANLAGAEIRRGQIEAQTRIREQAVIAEVRDTVQAVNTARQRVLAARRARENAEIQLEGERRLYESGRGTTFLLFQRENALTNARNAEIRAETDFNKALADLQRATANTFRVNNIDVKSPTDTN